MNRKALVAALCIAVVAVLAVVVITTAVPREPQEAIPADAPEDTAKNAGTDTPEGAQPEDSGAMASPQWRSEQLKSAGSEGEKDLNKLSEEKGETGKDADAID